MVLSQVVQSDADAGKSITEIKGPATVFASVTWTSEDIVCTKIVVRSSEMFEWRIDIPTHNDRVISA